MLKLFVIVAICAAFVLFASMIGILVGSSLEQSETDNYTQPTVAHESSQKDGETRVDESSATGDKKTTKKRDWYEIFRERPTDWLLVLFNGLLVLATIALFVSGEKSVRAANRSAKIAEDSLTKLQRAFVGLQQIRYFSHVDDVGKVWWSIHIFWENSGASRAKNVRFFVAKYFEDKDLPEDFTFEVPEQKKGTYIEPKATRGSGELVVTGDDLVEARDGKKFLYFWGRIDYRDIFDDTPDHVTKFLTRVVGIRGDPTKAWDAKDNIVELTFLGDNRHTCADEGCSDNR